MGISSTKSGSVMSTLLLKKPTKSSKSREKLKAQQQKWSLLMLRIITTLIVLLNSVQKRKFNVNDCGEISNYSNIFPSVFWLSKLKTM